MFNSDKYKYDAHQCTFFFRYDVDSASRNLKDHVSTGIFFFKE